MAFATGKRSRAICDRCGFPYRYRQLNEEWNGLRTCPSCWEPKHPQLEPPKVRPDAEALRHARPAQKEAMVVVIGDRMPQAPFDPARIGMKAYLGNVKVVVN